MRTTFMARFAAAVALTCPALALAGTGAANANQAVSGLGANGTVSQGTGASLGDGLGSNGTVGQGTGASLHAALGANGSVGQGTGASLDAGLGGNSTVGQGTGASLHAGLGSESGRAAQGVGLGVNSDSAHGEGLLGQGNGTGQGARLGNSNWRQGSLLSRGPAAHGDWEQFDVPPVSVGPPLSQRTK